MRRVSYALEELQTGILEMFTDVEQLSRYKVDFGELTLVPRYIRPPRIAKPRRPKPPKPVASSRVCQYCRAQSPTHRCPVFIVGVST